MYDSIVLDRKQVVSKSLRAKYLWWLDKISMSVADVVLFDTNEHIKYVTKEFNLPKEKFERIFIGADTDIFFPVDDNGKDDDKFKVLFYGTFIPLQGVEYIIKAAKELENEKDILFIMIGNGQEKKKALSIAKELNVNNISFLDSYSQPRLSDEIAKADVCLGIFGDTEKARRVIPNKVFECVAMKRTVITADTLAARELFKDNEVVFVKISDSKAIAEAILKLKKDKTMAKIIAENGYKKFLSETTIKKLGYQLLNMIKRYEQ
ncbi:MAG: Alpha-D-kanosaminyltransferase [Parcubacteria group bacterium ADurb.Bin316]|nr:MAG: Alpha-D-kanosaminyltransferase [Parcubacteria group bacterium ADurb.Bin316]